MALAGSAAVGVQILLTDYWLWSAAPTHAYGLVLFVALDVALILGTLLGIGLTIFGAVSIAIIQLVAMLGDIGAGQPAGTPASAFRSYLLADTAYLELLSIQILIAMIAIGGWVLPHLHFHWPTSTKTVKR